MIYIYQIINKNNGKAYIGKTFDVRKRWSQHCSEAKQGGKRHFCIAIRKYGVDAFDVRTIDRASTDERASDLEKFYIKLFDTRLPHRGYNFLKGGGASCEELAKIKTRADVNDEELIRLYEQGISCSEIGKMFGMTWSPINLRLLKKGVRMRPRNEQRGVRRKDIPNEDVVRMYEKDKLSCEQIAKLFSTNGVTIHKRLRKLKVQMRPVGRQKSTSRVPCLV